MGRTHYTVDVTPEGNTEVKVFELEMYARKWTLAWSHNFHKDAAAFVRENIKFIQIHRMQEMQGMA